MIKWYKSSGMEGFKPEEHAICQEGSTRPTVTPLTVGLQDSQDLVTGDELDLGDTVRVSQDDTDLGGAQTSSGKLEDLVTDFLRGGLGPRGLRPSVRKGGGGWWYGSSRRDEAIGETRATEGRGRKGTQGRMSVRYEATLDSHVFVGSQIPFPGACILQGREKSAYCFRNESRARSRDRD